MCPACYASIYWVVGAAMATTGVSGIAGVKIADVLGKRKRQKS